MAKHGLDGRRWRRQQALLKVATISYGWKCWLCNEPFDWSGAARVHNHKREFTADHVVPRERGGGMALSNLRPAHRQCNSKRRDKPIVPVRSEDW